MNTALSTEMNKLQRGSSTKQNSKKENQIREKVGELCPRFKNHEKEQESATRTELYPLPAIMERRVFRRGSLGVQYSLVCIAKRCIRVIFIKQGPVKRTVHKTTVAGPPQYTRFLNTSFPREIRKKYLQPFFATWYRGSPQVWMSPPLLSKKKRDL
jgi:hypothetical protein